MMMSRSTKTSASASTSTLLIVVISITLAIFAACTTMIAFRRRHSSFKSAWDNDDFKGAGGGGVRDSFFYGFSSAGKAGTENELSGIPSNHFTFSGANNSFLRSWSDNGSKLSLYKNPLHADEGLMMTESAIGVGADSLFHGGPDDLFEEETAVVTTEINDVGGEVHQAYVTHQHDMFSDKGMGRQYENIAEKSEHSTRRVSLKYNFGSEQGMGQQQDSPVAHGEQSTKKGLVQHNFKKASTDTTSNN